MEQLPEKRRVISQEFVKGPGGPLEDLWRKITGELNLVEYAIRDIGGDPSKIQELQGLKAKILKHAEEVTAKIDVALKKNEASSESTAHKKENEEERQAA